MQELSLVVIVSVGVIGGRESNIPVEHRHGERWRHCRRPRLQAARYMLPVWPLTGTAVRRLRGVSVCVLRSQSSSPPPHCAAQCCRLRLRWPPLAVARPCRPPSSPRRLPSLMLQVHIHRSPQGRNIVYYIWCRPPALPPAPTQHRPLPSPSASPRGNQKNRLKSNAIAVTTPLDTSVSRA